MLSATSIAWAMMEIMIQIWFLVMIYSQIRFSNSNLTHLKEAQQSERCIYLIHPEMSKKQKKSIRIVCFLNPKMSYQLKILCNLDN